jgi:hypothetical protein
MKLCFLILPELTPHGTFVAAARAPRTLWSCARCSSCSESSLDSSEDTEATAGSETWFCACCSLLYPTDLQGPLCQPPRLHLCRHHRLTTEEAHLGLGSHRSLFLCHLARSTGCSREVGKSNCTSALPPARSTHQQRLKWKLGPHFS